MPTTSNHQRLPSLKDTLIRQGVALGVIVILLVAISLWETTHISGVIQNQLNQLQNQLSSTRNRFASHISWNNLSNQISQDTNNFLLEFELLTIDTEHNQGQIKKLVSRFNQHIRSLNELTASPSQEKNVMQLKKGLLTLEDIGLELLETTSTNERNQLYRDTKDFVDQIAEDALLLNNENLVLSEILKVNIETIIADSSEQQNQLKVLVGRHNLIMVTISLIYIVIILVSLIVIFGRFKDRLQMLEQYAIDIENEKYHRPPFSSKDITGRLAIRMGLMARTIRGGISTLKKSAREIEELAFYDTLTGLENRRMFNENLEKAVLLSRRYQEQYALVYLDLDFFKSINDNYGHGVGDKVLIRVARRLHLVLREEDRIARLGGDEFAMLLRSDNTDISILVERILKAIQQPVHEGSSELKVSASIGIAILGEDADNLPDLMRYADMALYKAKESGRNTYHYFSEQLEANSIKKHRILKDLEVAIQQNQLELVYQTQHKMADKSIVGVEALIRGPSPEGGFIYPDEFIPLAEESGLIMNLGEWIISRACQDGKILSECSDELRVSINLSTKQFKDPELIDKIVHHCQVNDLAHHRVELEVTESLLLSDMSNGVEMLNRMRQQGFRISLDDFGTGYSSLFYLKNLPVTNIKIDKSFVAGLPVYEKDMAIVEATIQLAHKLNLKVVAEGVETEEQFEYLKNSGCDIAQGYLLSKPKSLSRVLKDLEKQQHKVVNINRS